MLEAYLNGGYERVEGACSAFNLHAAAMFNQLQAARGVKGDLAEIGVYHGRFFTLLGLLAAADELSVAIDVFEELPNYDDGGGWSRVDIVRDNFAAHTGKSVDENVALMVADSMMLRPDQIRARLKNDGIRLFSIDGAHSHFHTVHDLRLAEDLVVPGGIVIVDDILNGGWCGVFEGVARYLLLSAERRLFPFMIGGNKLWLTTYDAHAEYLAHVAADQTLLPPRRVTNFFGVDVVGF